MDCDRCSALYFKKIPPWRHADAFGRAFELYSETVSLIVKIPFDSSFPSGHTLNGITAAVTLMFIDKRMGIPAIVLAVLIAFSRMYNFMHFPTDVLAGAVLGVVSAVFVNFLFKRAGKSEMTK